MNSQEQKYYIVVIHYGDGQKTERALASIEAGNFQPEAVFVVDHGPGKFETKNAQVIRPKENGGYAAGINFALGVLVGRGVSEKDVVVVMNNDLVFSKSTLGTLQQNLLEKTVVGPEMRYVNFWSGQTQTQPSHLPYLHGTFLAAPLKAFLLVQGLPADNFMYWEDVDFSYRLTQAGYKILAVPKLDVFYEESKKPAGDHLYYLVRNGSWWLENAGPFAWRGYWWVKNRLRLLWHRFFSDKELVAQALSDAVTSKRGSREKT